MAFEIYKCAVDASHQFSPLVNEYLYHPQRIRSLYHRLPKQENWIDLIEEKKLQNLDRDLLVQVLLEQHADIDNALIQDRIKKLGKSSTFTVCTAHQPLLFTGHAYFVHKILDVIKLASEIDASLASYDVLPVFYIGGDDSDWEEIGRVSIHNETFRYAPPREVMSGRKVIDQEIIDLLQSVLQKLSNLPHAQELSTMMRNAYQIGTTFTDATRKFVYHLFSEYPIIVMDADDPRLRASMRQALQTDLLEQKTASIMQAHLDILREGFKITAPPQPTNFFYIHNDLRIKINANQDRWHIGEDDWSYSRLENEIHEKPENFSANVIYRPLYQESILPNICFTGGGGELSYWLELKSLFRALEIPMPALKLRTSLGIIDAETSQNLTQSDYTFGDLFLSESDFLDKYVYLKNNISLLTSYKHDLDVAMENYLEEIHSNFELSANQSQYAKKTIDQLHLHLSKKIKKHLRIQEQSGISEYKNLQAQVLPHQKLQERGDSFIQYLAMYGKKIVDDLYEVIDDDKMIYYISKL